MSIFCRLGWHRWDRKKSQPDKEGWYETWRECKRCGLAKGHATEKWFDINTRFPFFREDGAMEVIVAITKEEKS